MVIIWQQYWDVPLFRDKVHHFIFRNSRLVKESFGAAIPLMSFSYLSSLFREFFFQLKTSFTGTFSVLTQELVLKDKLDGESWTRIHKFEKCRCNGSHVFCPNRRMETRLESHDYLFQRPLLTIAIRFGRLWIYDRSWLLILIDTSFLQSCRDRPLFFFYR